MSLVYDFADAMTNLRLSQEPLTPKNSAHCAMFFSKFREKKLYGEKCGI